MSGCSVEQSVFFNGFVGSNKRSRNVADRHKANNLDIAKQKQQKCCEKKLKKTNK